MTRAEIALKHFNEQKDFMNSRVNAGIELYRKGFKRLEVKDKNGEPVEGVKIRAVQKNHEFNFGCNMFLLDEFESEDKCKRYRELFPDLFNYAVVPFYWDAVEPEPGKKRFDKNSPKFYRRPPADLVTEYCAEKGLRMKAHCLVYDHFNPKWMPNDTLKYKELIRSHLEEAAKRYANVIRDWDVLNESLCWKCFGDEYASKFFRDEDYVSYPFEIAAALPFRRKFINDSDGIWENFHFTRSHYYLLLRDLERRGVKFDGIGLQFHQFVPKEDEEKYALERYNQVRMIDVLDTYESFNKPIHISEITISAYSNSDEDLEIQAKLAENMYKIWFSRKNVEAIIYWNLIDGYTYPSGEDPTKMTSGENKYFGGLLYPDLSPKPIYKALDKLINHEWHTESVLTTDGNGIATINGFKGDYELEIYRNEKILIKNTTVDARYDVTEKIVVE